MDLEDIMLGEISLSQEDTDCTNPLTWDLYREGNGCCQGLGEGSEDCLLSMEFQVQNDNSCGDWMWMYLQLNCTLKNCTFYVMRILPRLKFVNIFKFLKILEINRIYLIVLLWGLIIAAKYVWFVDFSSYVFVPFNKKFTQKPSCAQSRASLAGHPITAHGGPWHPSWAVSPWGPAWTMHLGLPRTQHHAWHTQ